jgi:cytochrome P450
MKARAICGGLADALADTDAEFVSAFAEPLPVRVLAEPMNLETAMTSIYRRWAADATAAIGTDVDDQQRVEAERGIVEMQRYFVDRLAHADKGDDSDFFSALMHATIEIDGVRRALTRAERLSLCRQVFIGGMETTMNLLTESLHTLAEQSQSYDRSSCAA